jgi:K+-sensing histidine kinase KdpD
MAAMSTAPSSPRRTPGPAGRTGRRLPVSADTVIMLTAVAAPVAAAACMIPFRGHLDEADGALVLVVAIVAVAATGRRLAAAVAALSAALSFDFFLTRPYESFRITRTADLVTELLLLVVGLAVGELAARGRQARHQAAVSGDEVTRLHTLTAMVAAGEEPHVIAITAAAGLRELLTLRDCRFTRAHPAPVAARITAEGTLVMGHEIWPTEDLGLPTKQVDLPVRGNGEVLGHFLLTPTPGLGVPAHRLIVAVSMADLLGAALATDHGVPSPN